METFFMTGNLLVICLTVGVLIGYDMRHREMAMLRKELNAVKLKYRQAHGFHDWFGTYDLESFDYGQMWYAMRTTSEGKRIVEGEAEQVFPGLMTEFGIFDTEAGMPAKTQAATFSKSSSNNQIYQESEKTITVEVDNLERPYFRAKVQSQSLCRSMPVLRTEAPTATAQMQK